MDQLHHSNSSGRTSLLLRLTWPFIAVAIFQALLAAGSIWILSTTRGFVAGESFWSKGQKDAVYYLEAYALTGNTDKYRLFQQALTVPQGDREARQALEQRPPDIAKARQGFLLGGNHPDDVPHLVWMMRLFKDFEILSKPIKEWLIGDTYIAQLQDLARVIAKHNEAGTADAAMRLNWQRQIHDINANVAPASRAFSDALGASSRQITKGLLWANLLTAIALIALSTWRVRSLVTQRVAVEHTLSDERERARTTLAALGDGVISTDAQGRVIYLNPAAEQLLAFTVHEAQGQPLEQVLQLAEGLHLPSTHYMVTRLLSEQITLRDGLTRQLLREGQAAVPITLVGSPVHNQGVFNGAVLVLHDVTSEQRFVDQLSWQASHDALTGLYNRREFERRLELLLAAPRSAYREGCLLYVDLDQFKVVNDTCGHHAGDDMLREVSRTLQSHLREGDTLARLGGDEFGILLEGCPLGVALRIAENLCEAVHALRVGWGEQQLRTGLSVGLVLLSPDLHSRQDALRVADMACYGAKEAGRNRVFVYQSEATEMSRRVGEMDWVQRLRSALDDNRFCLYAQEIAPLQSTSESGVHIELLLRLHDEKGQLVMPGSFIPAAEQYHMMPVIDRWVVAHALQALAQPLGPQVARPITTCAINLSGQSLNDESFLEFVRTQLAQHGVDPRRVCFEITETSAIAHLPSAVRLITELRHLGCRFSLDDFGVGMSSFGYLKHLPVDYIKIDGSFVKDLLADPTNRAIVEMINHIGHVMGKRTIGEFAENAQTIDALRKIGVDYAQGYAIARPAPLEQYLQTDMPAVEGKVHILRSGAGGGGLA
jgi:diguanylate cyclase (GGDEF)-like protein/PAS domain S-box-containing protein